MKLAILVLSIASTVFAAEGKWTPDQVLQLDPAWLKQLGLEIPPGRIWDPQRGAGLLSAVISTGGCSAAFISPTGLFLTNHHCLFGIVQEHSTPANDLITNGFLATGPSAELASKTTRITLPHRFTDVTREILAVSAQSKDDLARQRVIETREKQLVAACEQQKGHRCRVAAFDGGMQYQLIDTLEISDVRLVFAPARSIGEFGGEVDNFAWPRHAGDFAIGRAYVNGAPYKPEFWLPIAKQGPKAGDFVMVMGYPGLTYRSFTAAEMEERRDLFYQRRVDVLGEWIRVLEDATHGNAAGEIAVASNLKTLNNTFKNAQGQLEGFRRGRILEKQQASEQAVVEWARTNPKFADALAARDGLRKMVEDQKRTWERDFLITVIPQGAKALYFAITLARASSERLKPDAERDPAYMNRELPRLRDKLEREQKNFFAPADRKLFESFVRRALALSEGQRMASIDGLCGAAPNLTSAIAALYERSRVVDVAERLKMFDETPDQLRARKDPLLDLAFGLAAEEENLRQRKDGWTGTISRLRPVWRAAVIAHAGKPVAPDANSSLRVSFAQVKGYSPRDAIFYTPQSTLSGMLEKYTGKEPFDAPADLRDVAASRNFGPWMDPGLHDVPLDFLSDADTTGGNSGSPVVNGRGELVGVNFDRVWENVANDFGYNPEIARNVSVDARYLLWILDRVKRASWLLTELGL